MIDYTELIKELEVQAEKQKSVLLAVAADTIEKLVDDVERKHGKWVNYGDEYRPDIKCCMCGQRKPILLGNFNFNFCPNCGADMRIYNAEN